MTSTSCFAMQRSGYLCILKRKHEASERKTTNEKKIVFKLNVWQWVDVARTVTLLAMEWYARSLKHKHIFYVYPVAFRSLCRQHTQVKVLNHKFLYTQSGDNIAKIFATPHRKKQRQAKVERKKKCSVGTGRGERESDSSYAECYTYTKMMGDMTTISHQ